MGKAIPGQLARNPWLGVDMHIVANYAGEDGSDRAFYSDLTPKFSRYLAKRVKDARQNLITISGPPGTGKSTLGIDIFRLLDPDGDLEASYVYGPDDFARVLSDGPRPGRVLLFDEGSVILGSANSTTAEGKAVFTMLETLRSWGMTIIICIPQFARLNRAVAAQLVDFRIECPDKPIVVDGTPISARGTYELFIPVYSRWGDKPGPLYFQCIGAGVYDKLPKALDEQYQTIKLRHQTALVSNFVKYGKINPSKEDIRREARRKEAEA